MKEIKFNCPGCGQHIQCDPVHAGENVPCPGCAAMIRVPSEGVLTDIEAPISASEIPSILDDSDKVSYAPAQPIEGADKLTRLPANETAPEIPARTVIETPATLPVTNAKHLNPVTTIHGSELRCKCPVCQSELRIIVEAESASSAPHHKPDSELPEKHDTELPPPHPKHLSREEREQQIAAARESHPILSHPAIKPRLDRIFGDAGDKKAD